MNFVFVAAGDEDLSERSVWCCRRDCWYWTSRVQVRVSPTSLNPDLNIQLLVICNCSIINPGPRGLKVIYNNVQGLVSPGHLGSPSPPLNMTKVLEIQDYVYCNTADVIILNETWLKPKIDSSIIFPTNYKVFRLDRSGHTHPRDPLNPTRFRENGGGVLIAHRENINITSFKFAKPNARAELLTIFLTLSNGNKLCFSTFYRVGTLGDDNFAEFKQHFDCLFSARNISKHVLIGDFNFSGVSWPASYPRTRVEELFLSYLLDDLGHTQMINSSTHSMGRTLDLCFTNDPSCVTDINVLDQHSFCFSDHYPVLLLIDADVGRVRQARRSIRIYDKGDYEAMNADLSFIDWLAEFTGDINYNVNRFNAIITSFLDKHVPTKSVKPVLLPIWYGHECESARVRKENLRKRWKKSQSDTDYDNYKAARKHFKNVCESSARLYCDIDDHDVVSRKFWRQVKVTSKSTRIPPLLTMGRCSGLTLKVKLIYLMNNLPPIFLARAIMTSILTRMM